MASALGQGIRTEIALPIDGRSALGAGPGQELGLYLEVYYAALGSLWMVGNWPSTAFASLPDLFANAALAALACNLASETFDLGIPRDWEVVGGAAAQWRSSGTGVGECGAANLTGGAGRSACVVYDGSLEGVSTSLLSPWFSLAQVSAATLRYRGVYSEQVSAGSALTLEATTDGTAWTPLLIWSSNHGTSGGEAVQVDLGAYAGQPRVRLRWRFAVASGLAGAQIDGVGLTCGPHLFADGFESGLITHWSAEAP